jgi:iron complex outermembrane receptor protein
MPDARIERNLNVEGSLNYHAATVHTSLSYFHNGFKNFFYLAPDGTEYFGFQVYHFRQSDAALQGGEFTFAVNPKGTPLEVNAAYSLIEARKKNGGYLPFIPANKGSCDVRWHFQKWGRVADPVLTIGGQYVFDQMRPSEFETPTEAYFLLNAGLSAFWHKMNLSLSATNILNKYYYDHLSRYKYYGIANMGRSIVLNISSKF